MAGIVGYLKHLTEISLISPEKYYFACTSVSKSDTNLTFHARYYWIRSHYTEKASFPKRVVMVLKLLSIFSSEYQKVPPVNHQVKCLIHGIFSTFEMKSNDFGQVICEDLKKFSKLDNKAVNCKKTCFHGQIKNYNAMTIACLLVLLVFEKGTFSWECPLAAFERATKIMKTAVCRFLISPGMAVPAQFSNRWQKYEHKIRAQFYECKTRNSIFWKFLGNHMMKLSWKLYAGKFLGNYMLVTF